MPAQICTQYQVVHFSAMCYKIGIRNGISESKFLHLNPDIDCLHGDQVCISDIPLEVSNCEVFIRVSDGDICKNISQGHGIPLSELRELNPDIDCDFLEINQRLCVVIGEPEDLSSTQFPSNPLLIAGIITGVTIVFLLLMVTAIIVCIYFKRRLALGTQIQKDQIKMQEMIGEGNFCEVYNGLFQRGKTGGVGVALKKLKLTAQEKQKRQFLEEAFILGKVCTGQKNIVHYFGICLDSQPYLMVLEYCRGGSLIDYLRSPEHREKLSNKDLFDISKQVKKISFQYFFKLPSPRGSTRHNFN